MTFLKLALFFYKRLLCEAFIINMVNYFILFLKNDTLFIKNKIFISFNDNQR